MSRKIDGKVYSLADALLHLFNGDGHIAVTRTQYVMTTSEFKFVVPANIMSSLHRNGYIYNAAPRGKPERYELNAVGEAAADGAS